MEADTASNEIELREPVASDGAGIWHLVQETGVLDVNSPYAYLLMTTHFAHTCVVAYLHDELAGFVTGYAPPGRPEVLFVWQVAVSSRARKRGLAKRMLQALLTRERETPFTHLEATITPSNGASWRLFTSLAEDQGAPLQELPGFASTDFPGDEHEAETLIRIGPLREN